jgi:hypothetical protein
MAVRKLGTLLGTTGEFRALVQKTQRLAEWHKRYADCAPPALARSSRVAGFRSGTLVLWADNAAVAAKLKQLTPRLMTALNKQANEITSIRVQVQPVRVTPPAEKKRSLSGLPPQAVEEFAKLCETVPDSPLKAAIATLVAHHRRKPSLK